MMPVTGCGKGERDIAGLRIKRSTEIRATESAKQQPRGIGKPVTMDWCTMGQPWEAWPWQVGEVP